jgi:hypothetical protein
MVTGFEVVIQEDAPWLSGGAVIRIEDVFLIAPAAYAPAMLVVAANARQMGIVVTATGVGNSISAISS